MNTETEKLTSGLKTIINSDLSGDVKDCFPKRAIPRKVAATWKQDEINLNRPSGPFPFASDEELEAIEAEQAGMEERYA